MSLHDTLKNDMKNAMKAGEKDRLGVIRMALAAIKQIEVDTRETLNEKQTLAVIEKLVKQRRESAKLYRKGNRPELAEKEESEIAILEHYLPEPLDEAAVMTMIDEIMTATGASDMKDMGKVMGQLKARAQGQIDMSVAGALVRSKLN